MLPGFRFLFAAILLSASILVFGLGAASLLRATHQQYANSPSWRNGPQEQVFAQRPEQAPEPAQPVLAVLRAEPETTELTPSLRDRVPTIGLPANEPEQVAALTTGINVQPEPQDAVVVPPAETAPLAADAPVKSQAAPLAPADTLTPADTTASTATKTPAPAATAVDMPRTATPAPASRVPDIAAARMAALNELAPAKPKADSATPESKPRARKPKKRHRVVRRPPPQQLNQALDPFGQQQQTFAATATRPR